MRERDHEPGLASRSRTAAGMHNGTVTGHESGLEREREPDELEPERECEREAEHGGMAD